MRTRTKWANGGRAAILVTVALAIAGQAPAQSDGAEFFEKNVRPLFVQNCYGCHSSSSPAVMGGLRLDSRAGLEKGGSRGPSIVPGQPEKSVLIRAVRQVDEHLRMPPTGKLKDAEIAVLTQWVAMGAPWGAESKPAASDTQKFWSLVPPKDPPVPTVKSAVWVKSAIDAFILSALEAKGLRPAPPADKRTLIRRATFDLIGLPPTPAEVRAFLDDQSPDAFARVIDRLLASPRYGERWGRHWLDVARYADSNGLDENLVYKNAFRYRDYVIQAFNKDKPYDQFIHEQLAGDLLPPAPDLPTTYERWTATGFLTLGAKMLAEDDPVKMEMDIVDEQLDTTARAFMGLTIGCARCHDHKFDPIPTADYYSMAGIFKSSKTMENFKVVAKWHEYVLAPKEERDRLKAHEDKIEAKKAEIAHITKAEDEKLADAARRKAGAYLLAASDVQRYEQIHLKSVLEEASASPKAGMVMREAASFDSGNVPRKLEKGKPNVPEKQKGPYFAEYEFTVAKAGEYQIDLLDEEKGGGTADIWINGILEKRGAEPVENREASPESGGWSVDGMFPLKAGKNVLRLEHKRRFPYFARLVVAPNALPKGTPAPKSVVQVARQYGINPGILDQWGEELRRSKGAPHSVLYAWLAFGTTQRMEEWTSPAARLFQGFHPASRAELATRYQELFLASMQPADTPPADAGLQALRELLYEKFGPFRPPADAKQYYPAPVQDQLALLDKEEKAL